MEVIREVKRVIDSRVVIDLPDSFKETEVEILVLPLNREAGSIEGDIIESLQEVKRMREGKQPEKTARELLSEL